MKKLLTVMALATMTLTSSAQLRSGIDLKDLNTSVRPADDFYEYACGGWMKANPLPPAYSRYGSFDRLAEDNNKRINGILKELLENNYAQGSVEQKLSDLYKLAMDSARREKEGVAPLMGELKTLENAKPPRTFRIGENAGDRNKKKEQDSRDQRDLSDVNGPEGGMLPGEVSAKIQSMRGGGQKLSEKQNQFYSQKFGRDMSDVHVHTDAQSDTISRSLNARAFTIGSDVFLSKGVNPDGGGRDQQTMTHELTHVVQQGGHASSGPLKLGAADTAQEHEAESTAQREFDPKLKKEDVDPCFVGFDEKVEVSAKRSLGD